ncbi:MAG: HlyC/CorC family transporter [Clostridia bacterium]|nr:HlyC/CorC family transporter [Clostridia bacterium]MBQ6325039.1 HlyC/CorC family transporter [Clostridia bacterium]
MDDPFGPSIVLFIALLLAVIVRMAEAAVPFIDEGEAQKKADAGDAKARRALKLARKAEKPFGEFQMSWICLVLIAFTALWVLLKGRVSGMPAFALYGLLPFTLVSLILAGAIPCHLGAHFRGPLLDAIAPVADVTMTVLSPVTRLCMTLGALVLKPFHIKPADAGDAVTEEDIMQMVDIGEEKGAIESDEREMIENIFEFNNMNAGDCMIHRKDITAIDIESTDAQILETIRQSGLSRFPVYEGSIDNVLGILTTRDYLLSRAEGRNVPLRALVRPAHFVPESVRTDVLFQEMQSRKQHMAIVVDEYGGTSGLITLEDLLEEIVGNIYDEFDPKEEPEITRLSDGRWRISGSAELDSVAEALDIHLPDDLEYDTLGGLVFSRLTEIPSDGKHPVVECFGLRISVEQIADRRVEWAIVEKIDPQSESEGADSNEGAHN